MVEDALLIAGRIHCLNWEVDLVTLVDTGAGLCYLSPHEHDYKRLHLTRGKRVRVQVADGREVLLDQHCLVKLDLYDTFGKLAVSRELDLLVFPPCPSSSTIILGRTGIRAFGLYTGPGIVFTDVSVLVDHNSIKDDVREIQVASEIGATQRILDDVVREGWSPLIRAHAYECRLRPMGEAERRDTVEQTHVFEIGVPAPQLTHLDADSIIRDVCSAAAAHGRRVSENLRQKSDAILDDYLARGFWAEASPEECRSVSLFGIPTPIFVVYDKSSGQKPRIVCDFQVLNTTIPPAGNDNSQPCFILAALRMCAPEVVSVADAEKAFYKVRVVQRADGTPIKFWLVGASIDEHGRVMLRHFLTDRMAFGLSFGPSGLVTTMRSLFQSRPEFRAHIGWYIDDISQAGSATDVKQDFALIKEILGRCGHGLQPSKTGLISRVGAVDGSSTQTVNCFNTTLSYAEDGLIVDCDRHKARRSLEKLYNLDISSCSWTKAEWFGVAGTLGYDLLKAHPAESVMGDCLRSLIGKEFASHKWKTALDLTQLSERKRDALEIMKIWAGELMDAPMCRHVSPVGKTDANSILDIFVDASEQGAGYYFVWRGMTIWQCAWVWRSTEMGWHSNRKEALVLLAAHQAVADILRCLGSQGTQWNLRFYGDNKSALKWSTSSPMDVNRKQERRAIARIIDSIRDEHRFLKEYGTVRISHVPGNLNDQADQLSRFGDRRLNAAGETLASLLGEQEGLAANKSLIDLVNGESKAETSMLAGYVEPYEEDGVLQLLEIPPDTVVGATDTVHQLGEESDGWDNDDVDGMRVLSGYHDGVLGIMQHVDYLCRIEERSREVCDSWAETYAKEAYDLGSVLHMAAVLKWTVRAWKAVVKGLSISPYPEDFDADDRFSVARSAQGSVADLPKNLKGEVGPLIKDKVTSCWFFKTALPTALYSYRLFIPATCPQLQRLIILKAHKDCAHMGADYTHAQIKSWWLHKGMRATTDVLRYCIHCQMKHAGRMLGPKAEMSLKDVGDLPFNSLALDHLSLGGKVTVLTCLCLVTGYSVWMHCPSHNSKDTCIAFASICARLPRLPGMIFTDAAPVFGQVRADFVRRTGNALTHETTTSHSQFQNGKLERLHAVGLSVLGSKLHLDSLKVVDLPISQLQRLLDEVCQVLNSRPICQVYADQSGNRWAITPNVLVYGSSVATDFHGSDYSRPVLPQVQEWIGKFQGLYWSRLKEESTRVVGSRADKYDFRINETVLYFMPQSGKLGLNFRLGVVKDVVGNYCQLSVRHDKVIKVHVHNVVPLRTRYDTCRSAFAVTREGARIEMVVEGIAYCGTVLTECEDGTLEVQWDLVAGTGWRNDFLHPSAVRFL